MRRNKSKRLPTKPLVWLSDAGRQVWPTVLESVRLAGHDDSRFLIPVGLLSDAFGAFLQSCELKTSEHTTARRELIELNRSRLLQVLESFPGVVLPHVAVGDELRATRLSCQCELREIECEIAGTVAESDTWYGLLQEQSAIHWRLVTLGLLIDSDEFIRRLEAAEDEGESWKQGADE